VKNEGEADRAKDQHDGQNAPPHQVPPHPPRLRRVAEITTAAILP
jgi:hypothetical protein